MRRKGRREAGSAGIVSFYVNAAMNNLLPVLQQPEAGALQRELATMRLISPPAEQLITAKSPMLVASS